jgi:hypothetical protein
MRTVRIAFRSLLVVLVLLLAAHHWAVQRGGPQWLQFGQPRHSFAHSPCGIPIHFALGELDARFGFDRFTLGAALVEAANLWQASVDVMLFLESDDPQAMTVSLVFDQRQYSANVRRSLRGSLDRDRRELESDEATLRQWAGRIDEARLAYERDSEALAHRVRAHEAEVAAWHGNASGRSEARRRALDQESVALRAAIAELERMLLDLNSEVASYNRRAGDLRRQAEDFRARISDYNTASSTGPVESGRYSYDPEHGRRIAIFRAESHDELVWILAHELGHALGLDHVDEPGAIMHALLHEEGVRSGGRPRPVELTDSDRAALRAVCGRRIEVGAASAATSFDRG